MKTLINFCVIAVLGIAFASFSFADNAITLDTAIVQGKVKATVQPYGDNGHSGIHVKVKNISGKNLRLIMPKGTVFIPDNPEEQTLVTSEDEIFALNAGVEKEIVRKGYCTELHDSGSDDESTFKLGRVCSENLLNIITFIDSLGVKDEDMIQHAVWCVTDDSPVAYIQSETDTVRQRLLRQRVCSLTNQRMPWYNTKSEIVITPQREYIIEAKEIAGDIVIDSDVPIVMQGQVKDANGKVLFTNPNQSRAPAGETTFEYVLHVEGWVKGTYYVVYTCNGNEVINREFQI